MPERIPVNAFSLTAARLTAGGRGAVATIRICARPAATDGSPAGGLQFQSLNGLFNAINGQALNDQPLQKIVFGHWREIDAEDLVVCRVATSIVEIHCHGGDAAVQRILNDLSAAGCNIIDWREQVTATQSGLDVECLEVLSRTSTWRTTRIALEQANGLLRDAFLNLERLAERDQVDFQAAVDTLLQWSTFGLHLSKPWNVVLTGCPNVGKSSLINALLGYQRAIVFDQPGTTRDIVTGETAFDGWPVMLSDTAGIRNGASELEVAGIARAFEWLRTADLRLLLIDVGEAPTADDEALIRQWPDAIIVAHKSDRPNLWGDRLPAEAIPVSSVTGEGLAELQRQLINGIVPSVPVAGTPVPITARQIDLLKAVRLSRTSQERRQVLSELSECRNLAHALVTDPASH